MSCVDGAVPPDWSRICNDFKCPSAVHPYQRGRKFENSAVIFERCTARAVQSASGGGAGGAPGGLQLLLARAPRSTGRSFLFPLSPFLSPRSPPPCPTRLDGPIQSSAIGPRPRPGSLKATTPSAPLPSNVLPPQHGRHRTLPNCTLRPVIDSREGRTTPGVQSGRAVATACCKTHFLHILCGLRLCFICRAPIQFDARNRPST